MVIASSTGALCLVLVVAAVACGGNDGDSGADGGGQASDATTGDSATPGSDAAPGSVYSLNLSGVTQRQLMQSWDPAWISEYSDAFDGYAWQVDPGNGGQVGVWTGTGNPSVTPGDHRDYSQFIAAGPPAGAAVRVRMKFRHADDGSWVSCAHASDSNSDRAHYEVALQSGALRIYKFWGPDPFSDYASVASTGVNAPEGSVYWLYLVETRSAGTVTIRGELRDDTLAVLASVVAMDDGSLGGQPVIASSNKRGFGSYSQADGLGPKIFEWHVETAP